jgi:2-desacetyl-2-hydroxyethyl bacteriochlorophyllide A dehydrogenase
MQALLWEGPGRLAVRDVPVPEPVPGEALVRVHYVGICGTDLHLWLEGAPGVEPPVILGHEVVGQVATAVGSLAAGQRVAVEPLRPCGACGACRGGQSHVCRRLQVLGVHTNGGAAEYLCVPLERLHPVPDSLSWEVAGCTEPVAVAVHMVRRVGVELGDVVLVLGGGPIGFLVACVARAAGAGRVLVSEVSPARLELCRRAGLEVIDASQDDPEQAVRACTAGEGADVVFEAAGSAQTAATMLAAARVRGRVLLGAFYSAPPSLDLRPATLKELHLFGSRVYESRDVATALTLLASGAVDVAPLVTRVVPLAEAVTAGFEPLRASRDEMKVLIRAGQ